MSGPERSGTGPFAGGGQLVEWDLRTGLTDVTGHGITLRPHGPVRVSARDGVVLDGRSAHLSVPAADVGPLDVSRAGDAVSVAALLRRDGTGTGFVAGMWQEDDTDPRRRYGLFVSLPVYGGDQQVCGHVSADGRPSPGLPWSRDYSASASPVPVGRWTVAAFDYDGAAVRSYVDGRCEPRPAYTEPGPPVGEGLTYPKNPYSYPHGLHRGPRCDFTVGAVLLTTGLGNFFHGAIARLAVAPAAAGGAAMAALARHWAPPPHGG